LRADLQEDFIFKKDFPNLNLGLKVGNFNKKLACFDLEEKVTSRP